MKIRSLTLAIIFLIPAFAHAEDTGKKAKSNVENVVVKITEAELAQIRSQATNHQLVEAKDKSQARAKIDEMAAKLTKSALDLSSKELLCKTGCGEWATEAPPADVLKTLAFDFPKPEAQTVAPTKSPEKKKDKKPATNVATVDCASGAHCQGVR